MIEFFLNLIIFVSVFTVVPLLLIFTFVGWIVCIEENGFFSSIIMLPFIVFILIINIFTWFLLKIIQCSYSVILGFYGVLRSGSFKAFKSYFMKGWMKFLPPKPFESDD